MLTVMFADSYNNPACRRKGLGKGKLSVKTMSNGDTRGWAKGLGDTVNHG